MHSGEVKRKKKNTHLGVLMHSNGQNNNLNRNALPACGKHGFEALFFPARSKGVQGRKKKKKSTVLKA